MDKNQESSRPVRNSRPSRQRMGGNWFNRMRPFGINPIIIAAAIISILIVIAGSLTNTEEVSRIGLGQLVNNLQNNRYSRLEIRDDRIAEATPKYVLRTAQPEGSVFDDLKDLIKLNVATDFKEVSLQEFIDTTKVQNPIDRILNPSPAGVFSEVVIADNYVLALQALAEKPSLIVRNTNPAQFEDYLKAKDVNLNNRFERVTRLVSAAKDTNAEELKWQNDNGNLWWVIKIDNQVISAIKPSKIKTDSLLWDYRVTDGLASYLTAQGIKLHDGHVELELVTVPYINWGDILSLVMIGVAVVFAFFLLRGVQSGGSGLMKFGQSRAKLLMGAKPETTFKDVAGVDEAKEELVEIVQFLRNPNKFLKLGARIPKGVIMVGPPGTGKTLLARAIAGEAGVPFFHTSGSEFEEMLVGAGASRVRDLFEKAKKAAPSLIFIDEIDAVARKRGTTIQSSTTEQTLNQILTEMDGFEKNTSVIIIAATNRPDVLDPAILRPGRFDRRVVIDNPDMTGRRQILDIHAKNKPLAKDVDLDKLAKRTIGFSGAELENTLNEAAIIAAKDNRKEITAHDIEEAANKTMMGPARKSKQRTGKELNLVAVHEAGHAVVAHFTPESDPVHKVSIVSRGSAGGVTQFLPKEDENIITKSKLYARIVVALGGRAAEEVVLGDISTGASGDIDSATRVARQMVQKFGMSEKLGLIKYGESNELQYLGYGYGEQRDYSDETAKLIDEEVREIVSKAYTQALKTLKDHRAKLDQLTKLLLEKEVVDGEEFDQLFNKNAG